MLPTSSKFNTRIPYIVLFIILFIPLASISQEICDNGMDDDGDGLIDLNDIVDCGCNDSIALTQFEDLTCTEFHSFVAVMDYPGDNTYQWYKDGIAMSDENDYLLLVMGNFDGQYEVIVTRENGSCLVSYPLVISVPDYEMNLIDTFCQGTTYEFGDEIFSSGGDYYQFLTAQNGCDSTIILTLIEKDCADTVKFIGNNLRREIIEFGADLNGDGSIQFSEAEMIDTLILHTDDEFYIHQIRNTSGLEAFINLKYLDISKNDIFHLRIDSLKNLEYLDCSDNGNLNLVEIDSLTNLRYIDASNTQLDDFFTYNNPNLETYINESSRIRFTLDFSYNPKLVTIYMKGMLSGDSIILTSCPDLKTLYISSGGNLDYLDLTQNTKLEYLTLNQASVEHDLDLTKNVALKEFCAFSSFIQNIDLTKNINLEKLSLRTNQLKTLDLTGNGKLKYVNVKGNQSLAEIDLSKCHELTNLICDQTDLTTLDLSNCFVLDSLECSLLKTLFIKNGSIESYLRINFNVWMEYVCVDEEQYDHVRSIIYSEVPVDSYCYFAPGGANSQVRGQLFFDTNNDNCQSEIALPADFKFYIDDGQNSGYAIRTEEDEYVLDLREGITTVTPIFENSSWFNIEPPYLEVDFPTDVSPYNQDFCISASESIADVTASIIPIGDARPGFDASYKIIYSNQGTVPTQGKIKVYIPEGTTYKESSLTPSSIEDNRVEWNYSDINPFLTEAFFLTLTLNTPTDPFPLDQGDTLLIKARIFTDNDVNEDNNKAILSQRVINSFDPNDKKCLEGEIIPPSKIGEFVHYQVRFENVGSADAVNVIVRDTIDTSSFEITSLIPIDGSHDFSTRIRNDSIVEFYFENINLPFDDENNDGYVCFKLKTSNNLILGSTLENKAEIFFDYNHPIVTNTYLMTVDSSFFLNTSEVNQNLLIAYPNPIRQGANLYVRTLKDGKFDYSIYNVAGELVKEGVFYNSLSLPTNGFSRGLYFCVINTPNAKQGIKFIVE